MCASLGSLKAAPVIPFLLTRTLPVQQDRNVQTSAGNNSFILDFRKGPRSEVSQNFSGLGKLSKTISTFFGPEWTLSATV